METTNIAQLFNAEPADLRNEAEGVRRLMSTIFVGNFNETFNFRSVRRW
jgi:hypothetical protein